jgi:plastocyanin
MQARFAGCVLMLAVSLTVGCGRSSERPQPEPASDATQPAAAKTDEGYQITAVPDVGRIAGIMSISGPLPKLTPRPINKDAAVCGTGAKQSEELIVANSGGLKNVVILVEGIRRGKPMPSLNPVIDQTKCEYVPHVQAMASNSDLSIINSDPILHNIHVYQGDNDLFNVAQPVKGQTNTHRISRSGFIYVECDVHGWMRGHIAVVDSPYFAISDDHGRFEMSDVPPGTYNVRVWHEYLGESEREVTVMPNGNVRLDVDFRDALAKKLPAAAPAVPASTKALETPPTSRSSAKVLSGEVTVNMVSQGGTFAFEPPDLTVKAGTTVKWVNNSDNRHTATGDPKFEKSPGQTVLPPGASPWSTPFIANGQNTSHTFTAPGRYQYFCRNHGQFGMVATITVVP